MSGVLHHRIHRSEELARTALYRLLFNFGFQTVAFLAILLVVLMLLSRSAY